MKATITIEVEEDIHIEPYGRIGQKECPAFIFYATELNANGVPDEVKASLTRHLEDWSHVIVCNKPVAAGTNE